MADLFFVFHVARYEGSKRSATFGRPIRTIAKHPIAAAERVTHTKLYLIGEPENLFAAVSYTNLDGSEERILLYHGLSDRTQASI